MGIFLLGALVGFIMGVFWFAYKIVNVNQYDPARFDQIIVKLRKKLKQLSN